MEAWGRGQAHMVHPCQPRWRYATPPPPPAHVLTVCLPHAERPPTVYRLHADGVLTVLLAVLLTVLTAGYSYRLCKYEPGVNVTEACFQQFVTRKPCALPFHRWRGVAPPSSRDAALHRVLARWHSSLSLLRRRAALHAHRQ